MVLSITIRFSRFFSCFLRENFYKEYGPIKLSYGINRAQKTAQDSRQRTKSNRSKSELTFEQPRRIEPNSI
jgi:hypothetical protein